MSNFIEYFDENEISELHSVNFFDPGAYIDLDFKIQDDLDILDFNNKLLVMEYRRNLIDIQTDEIFLEVSAIITFMVKKNFENTIILPSSIETLQRKILENEEFFLSCTISGVSLLISQLLSTFGKIPPITPPLFLSEMYD